MFRRTLFVGIVFLSAVIVANAAAYKESTLYNFGVMQGDGTYPEGTPVMDSAGNFYGVTYEGGAYQYYGTVYKMDSSGNESILHSFDNTDGANPDCTLTIDSAGNLYGTTNAGGITSTLNPQGMGVVFKVSAAGTFSVLYEFGASSSDGNTPYGQLALDSAGNLYGTTSLGGGNCKVYGSSGCGTVFKLTPKGVETILYRFTGGNDGYQPFSNIVRDSAGNLYGTASAGGAHLGGVLFKLSPQNKLTVVHAFCSQTDCDDGGNPRNIFRTSAGTIYGATPAGGPYGRGIAFKINSKGVETVLHTFCPGGPTGKCGDGQAPLIGMLSGSALYGTTSLGGNKYGNGTAFSLSTSGSFSVLFDFGNTNVGTDAKGLTMDNSGNLFGVSMNGGEVSGTFFELIKQ